MKQNYDVIIIGGGAAGLMCAIQAGRRGRSVVVLEGSHRVGRKILISGGGRCNFTNKQVTPQDYVSGNPHFCKSALAQYTPEHFIAWVEEHHIDYYEKQHGQLFCRDSARDIIQLLQQECQLASVDIVTDVNVQNIIAKDSGYQLMADEQTMSCQSLVIATGGLSFPQIGATPFGYDIAKQFGLRIIPTTAALDGFQLDDELLVETATLKGVSLPVSITTNGHTCSEDLLFTHMGLSGPAALQASLYWQAGTAITIDCLPDQPAWDWFMEMKEHRGRALLKNLLSMLWPQRFAAWFCQYHQWSELSLNQISHHDLKNYAKQIHQWNITPTATVGYKKAEVTRGGVDTNELSSKTMEAKCAPGLYFIGEVVDVTGRLGGYNFQWAWSSGYVAGQVV